MKCTRCFRNAEAIMCSTCYTQNCKHNEQGRRTIMQKYEHVTNIFQQLVSQNLHHGNTLALINRKALMIHSQKCVEELLQTKHDELQRKKKQNQLLRQKIADRRAYVQRLQLQTKNIEAKVKAKQKQRDKMMLRTQDESKRIKQKLQAKFKQLMRYVKQDLFNSSKEEWNKFINMEENILNMYVILLQNEYEPQVSNIHEQIKKQMIVLTIVSNLLQISLPYPIDLQHLMNKKSVDLILVQTNSGKILNKQFLRQFQANANYLFSRFDIQMEHPRINSQTLSQLLSIFKFRRLKIFDETNSFDYTKPIYISSLQMVEAIISKPIIFSESIGMTMDSIMFELTAQGLQRHHKLKEVSKVTLQQETTEEIEYTEIIQLTGFRQISSSDQQMEILQ